MKARIPIKYRGFPGPFIPYRPIAAQPNHPLIFCLMFLLTVPIIVLSLLFFSDVTMGPQFIIMGSVLAIGTYFWRTRWKRRLVRHQWLLCLQCAYPLDMLPPEGRCPECGKPYNQASTSWGWRVLCNQWTVDMDPPPPLPPKSTEG